MSTPNKCIICGRYSWSGINILGKFMCDICEKNLVNTDISSDVYDDYKELIKKNIYNDIQVK